MYHVVSIRKTYWVGLPARYAQHHGMFGWLSNLCDKLNMKSVYPGKFSWHKKYGIPEIQFNGVNFIKGLLCSGLVIHSVKFSYCHVDCMDMVYFFNIWELMAKWSVCGGLKLVVPISRLPTSTWDFSVTSEWHNIPM